MGVTNFTLFISDDDVLLAFKRVKLRKLRPCKWYLLSRKASKK
jgi:hypothetical protein